MTIMLLQRWISRSLAGVVPPLAVCALVLALGGCASAPAGGEAEGAMAGGEPAAMAADGGQVGVVSSEGKVTKRLIWLWVYFADSASETIEMREGQTVTYERPDGIFRFTPTVSKKTVGKVEVHAERDSGGSVDSVDLILSVGEEMNVALEFPEIGWPSVAVRVVRVQPPIRRGPNPIGD